MIFGTRRERERDTIAAMVGIYCHDHHERRAGLCGACGELLAYAGQRLDRCLFRDDKPTCADCPVHCYKPAMRTQVRDVMRYAGPRMTLRHPILALLHVFEGWKKRDLTVRRRPEAAPGRCAVAPAAEDRAEGVPAPAGPSPAPPGGARAPAAGASSEKAP